MGQHHVGLRSKPKHSPEKVTLILVEIQRLPDIEKGNSKQDIVRLKWTIYNGSKKVFINFQTDTDNVNMVVYRYRNNTYLKDTEMELKLTEYGKLLPKRVYFLSYSDIFFKRRILLNETTVHN